ncbi:hypothetical protein N9C13_00930 [bacterium]|jgi:hypothetical protein|nr:hypothetical protein [bacterium]
MQIENESCLEPRETRAANFKRAVKNNGWLFITTVTYLITLYLVRENQAWDPKMRVAVTLLPLLPGLVYLRVLWGTFKSLDELQRRIQLEAWAVALGGTVIVSTAMNVLNANGIGFENYPHGLELGGAYMAVFLFWCVGVAEATARYR